MTAPTSLSMTAIATSLLSLTTRVGGYSISDAVPANPPRPAVRLYEVPDMLCPSFPRVNGTRLPFHALTECFYQYQEEQAQGALSNQGRRLQIDNFRPIFSQAIWEEAVSAGMAVPEVLTRTTQVGDRNFAASMGNLGAKEIDRLIRGLEATPRGRHLANLLRELDGLVRKSNDLASAIDTAEFKGAVGAGARVVTRNELGADWSMFWLSWLLAVAALTTTAVAIPVIRICWRADRKTIPELNTLLRNANQGANEAKNRLIYLESLGAELIKQGGDMRTRIAAEARQIQMALTEPSRLADIETGGRSSCGIRVESASEARSSSSEGETGPAGDVESGSHRWEPIRPSLGKSTTPKAPTEIGLERLAPAPAPVVPNNIAQSDDDLLKEQLAKTVAELLNAAPSTIRNGAKLVKSSANVAERAEQWVQPNGLFDQALQQTPTLLTNLNKLLGDDGELTKAITTANLFLGNTDNTKGLITQLESLTIQFNEILSSQAVKQTMATMQRLVEQGSLPGLIELIGKLSITIDQFNTLMTVAKDAPAGTRSPIHSLLHNINTLTQPGDAGAGTSTADNRGKLVKLLDSGEGLITKANNFMTESQKLMTPLSKLLAEISELLKIDKDANKDHGKMILLMNGLIKLLDNQSTQKLPENINALVTKLGGQFDLTTTDKKNLASLIKAFSDLFCDDLHQPKATETAKFGNPVHGASSKATPENATVKKGLAIRMLQRTVGLLELAEAETLLKDLSVTSTQLKRLTSTDERGMPLIDETGNATGGLLTHLINNGALVLKLLDRQLEIEEVEDGAGNLVVTPKGDTAHTARELRGMVTKINTALTNLEKAAAQIGPEDAAERPDHYVATIPMDIMLDAHQLFGIVTENVAALEQASRGLSEPIGEVLKGFSTLIGLFASRFDPVNESAESGAGTDDSAAASRTEAYQWGRSLYDVGQGTLDGFIQADRRNGWVVRPALFSVLSHTQSSFDILGESISRANQNIRRRASNIVWGSSAEHATTSAGGHSHTE